MHAQTALRGTPASQVRQHDAAWISARVRARGPSHHAELSFVRGRADAARRGAVGMGRTPTSKGTCACRVEPACAGRWNTVWRSASRSGLKTRSRAFGAALAVAIAARRTKNRSAIVAHIARKSFSFRSSGGRSSAHASLNNFFIGARGRVRLSRAAMASAPRRGMSEAWPSASTSPSTRGSPCFSDGGR